MKITTNQRIVDYLRTGNWISGLELELQATKWFSKPSTISRRARELADSGTIERMLKGKTVQYRRIVPIVIKEQGVLFDARNI